MANSKRSDTFCINDYDVIGFDLDGCLLKYRWDPFFKMLHEFVRNFLITVKDYNPDVVRPFDLGWKEVMFRGILVDTKRGNILWVLGDGTIKRAYHGTEKLTTDQIGTIYPQSYMPALEQMRNNFVSVDEYHMADNYFEGSLVMVYCDLIEALDSKLLPDGSTCQSLWDDIWESYMCFFSVTDKRDLGPKFLDVSKQPSQYGLPCGAPLRKWLKSLKAANKCVFLMTSSYVVFAKGVLNYILGPDYDDYFDFGIGAAGKPSFFYSNRKFVDVDARESEVTQLQPKHWYEHGSLDIFTQLVENFTGISQPKILYVGDGLKNDAFPSTRFARWGALIILEGMEVEGCGWSEDSKDILNPTCDKVVAESEGHYVGNSNIWGSFFSDNGTESLFARVIRESADLAVPWLDYIAGLPLDYRFPRFDAELKTLGYFPPLLHLATS